MYIDIYIYRSVYICIQVHIHVNIWMPSRRFCAIGFDSRGAKGCTRVLTGYSKEYFKGASPGSPGSERHAQTHPHATRLCEQTQTPAPTHPHVCGTRARMCVICKPARAHESSCSCACVLCVAIGVLKGTHRLLGGGRSRGRAGRALRGRIGRRGRMGRRWAGGGWGSGREARARRR